MLLSLLDDFIRDELTSLIQQETEIGNEIRRVFGLIPQLEQTNRDLLRLRQEITERERQLEALASLKEDAKRHQDLTKAGSYFQGIQKSLDTDVRNLYEISAEISSSHVPIEAAKQGWPNGEWIDEKDELIRQAKEDLSRQIHAAVEHYETQMRGGVFGDNNWAPYESLIASADEEFGVACAEKGISPADITHIQEINQQLVAKRAELARKQAEGNRLQKESDRLPELFSDLHSTWMSMYSGRVEIAQEVEELTQNTIELEIEYASDPTAFFAAWAKIIQDRRTHLGRSWDDLGGLVLQVFTRLRANATDEDDFCNSPWQMIENWLNGDTLPSDIEGFLKNLNIRFSDIVKLVRTTSRDQWQNARLTRVAERADLILNRADGSGAAGRISDGSLSDGQRNTAALAMILAKGDTPLVFDQPEDELDLSFIFRELVPMLRRIKVKRQIIVVTHNANVPVNADAEYLYALETKEGRGVPRAHGGLDQETVTQAVLEIMEGSEQAFRRRGEKYHF